MSSASVESEGHIDACGERLTYRVPREGSRLHALVRLGIQQHLLVREIVHEQRRRPRPLGTRIPFAA